MRIIDLRPWAVRAWSRRWETERPIVGAPHGVAAGLAARVTDAVVRARVARRRPPPRHLCVVSVGNLAFGGTGKTPVTAALARDLASQGRGGAVLTRGYGSPRPGPLEVGPNDAWAGDEARLLAAAVAASGWSVVQSRDRRRGLALLEAKLRPGSVVLLEDGHQTAGVGRDLDVVILDRWSERQTATGSTLAAATGPVAPFGPWRESAAGAERAGIWLVEADAPPAASDGRPVAGFVRRLSLGDARGDGGPWAALSGIARPVNFERGVAAARGTPPALVVRCADHEAYGGRVRRRVWRELRAAGSPLTVTTEKDWIKLRDGWPADLPVAVATLEVRWTGARTLPDLVGERCDACRE